MVATTALADPILPKSAVPMTRAAAAQVHAKGAANQIGPLLFSAFPTEIICFGCGGQPPLVGDGSRIVGLWSGVAR